MPDFIIHTTATATIKERWRIQADTIEQAEEIWDEHEGTVAELIDDEVAGDETDRQFAWIEEEDAAPPAPVTADDDKITAVLRQAIDAMTPPNTDEEREAIAAIEALLA